VKTKDLLRKCFAPKEYCKYNERICQVKKNYAYLVSLLVASIFLLGFPLKAQSNDANTRGSEGICAAELPAKIDEIVNRREFERSRWGIKIATLSPNQPGETLYALEANKYFIPASTAKLLTTAAALEALDPNFRIRTSVYGTQNGNVASVRLVGRGDPSIAQPQLAALAKQLRDRGITQIDQLIAEDAYFQGAPINSNWEWEDVQAGYGTSVNSLIFNQNAIDLLLSPQKVGEPLQVTLLDSQERNKWQLENNSVTVDIGEAEFVEVGRDLRQTVIRVSGQLRVGSAPEPVYAAVVDPGDRFLAKFREALIAAGISVNKTQLSTQSLANSSHNLSTELAAIESPPLSELVKEVNQTSNNLYAEAILRHLGVSIPPNNRQKTDSSADAGLAVVTATLAQSGVNPDSYRLADGSGLSRHNLISPEALIQTLRVMAVSPRANLYRDSLPVRRLSNDVASATLREQIMVQAKSGGMSGISSLAGYITLPDYDPLVFAIILNNSDNSRTVVRQAINQIIDLLAMLRRC